MDHYSTLGVSKTATPDEIKKAYRKLASQHHPDKGGDTAMFQKVEEAYRVLSDPQKRQQYDNPMHQQMPHGFGFNAFDVNDLFKHIFEQQGFHQQARSQNRPQLYRTIVSITLEQCYHGGTIPLKLQTFNNVHNVSLDIPRGIQSGEQIRYDSLIPNTNLIVEFRVEPNLVYERKGVDLYCNHRISVLDLIVGTKFEIDTISGKKFEVTVPPKTQPYAQLKVAGQGMPIRNTNMYGDQIILIRPFIPDNIDDEITQSILRSKTK